MVTSRHWCRSLLRIGGGRICNFTPILPYFQHWGDEPWPRFFPGEQIKWRPKKKSSPKMEYFFPRIQVETRAQMHTEVKLLGGCRWRPYSNYWGRYSQIIGGDISCPGFGTPGCRSTCTTRGSRPRQFKFNIMPNKHFPWLFFFFLEVFYRVKTGEVEVNCYWKI